MRRRVAALDFLNQSFNLWICSRMFRRTCERDAARHALLQQELRSLDDRFGVKARAHLAVVQRVGNADNSHCLMMGHVGADDRKFRALGKTRARIVERLVPTIGAKRPQAGHSRVVPHNRGRRDH